MTKILPNLVTMPGRYIFFIPTNNRKGTIFKPNLSYTFLLELTSCDKVITRTPTASNWCLQRITSSTFAKNGQRFAHNVMTDYRCLANITLQYKSTFINAINFSLPVGREPWSSGYGRRLMFQRLWVRIPALYTGWTFFRICICCKICYVFDKTKINEKEAGVGPFF